MSLNTRMAIFPVIMCGGSGTRLWPASRPSRPKQFIPLAGNRSLFQETALRVAPLAEGGGRLIVVGGVGHRDWIVDQLDEIGLDAQILLEPEARDSAPAMAAAAVWTQSVDPDGVIAFVASDHHVPDHGAFRRAVHDSLEAARSGRIVTLGVKPTEPSSAYGYIRPSGVGLSEVHAFQEKPDALVAASYIQQGFLWNSGNFIVSARSLIEELVQLAPAVEAAARTAMPVEHSGSIQILGPGFLSAPRISIDYAVMEKTRRASVIEVDFAWSDLGAWDAIHASGEGDTGQHIFEDAEGCLVRASDGVLVAAMGVRNLAIVAEADAILVCDLARAQDVKKVVERIRTMSPQHLDFARRQPESLRDGARRFADWLRMNALPLWCTIGQSEDGGFAEALSLDGRPLSMSRRARVQARQIYVYAKAGALGWGGPWRLIVQRGVTKLLDDYLRDDGLCRATLTAESAPLDETAMLYDQAFVMFALATVKTVGVVDDRLEACAKRIRDTLVVSAQPNGALLEAGDHPHQANAHMHLLEACLAWEEGGGDAGWTALADRLVGLALSVFIDSDGGFLREYFDADWAPAQGEDGRLVEPGHQFEWAWLLARYARSRQSSDALRAAHRLYEVGRRGIGDRPVVAIDALNDDMTIRSNRARLWPQTEWLKAALILSESASDGDRSTLIADAAAAQRALWLYLTPHGLWRDKQMYRGGFMDEPAPASSLYHIVAAFDQICETARIEGIDGLEGLSLR
jgi:mannose-1-phosphate guanylyltransferase / mannose-6-phosphate isomerase